MKNQIHSKPKLVKFKKSKTYINCIGVGEEETVSEHEVLSGNVKLRLSHVVPDLINKCLKGQDPLHILGSGSQIRHYTNGKDIASGIRICLEHEKSRNEDFNISSSTSTTVLELAEKNLDQD